MGFRWLEKLLRIKFPQFRKFLVRRSSNLNAVRAHTNIRYWNWINDGINICKWVFYHLKCLYDRFELRSGEKFHAKLNLHTNNRFVCTIKHIRMCMWFWSWAAMKVNIDIEWQNFQTIFISSPISNRIRLDAVLNL